METLVKFAGRIEHDLKRHQEKSNNNNNAKRRKQDVYDPEPIFYDPAPPPVVTKRTSDSSLFTDLGNRIQKLEECRVSHGESLVKLGKNHRDIELFLNKETSALAQRLQGFQSDQKTLQAKVQSDHTEIEQLKAQVQGLTDSLADLSAKYSQCLDGVKESSAQISDLSEIMKQMKQTFEDIKKSIQENAKVQEAPYGLNIQSLVRLEESGLIETQELEGRTLIQKSEALKVLKEQIRIHSPSFVVSISDMWNIFKKTYASSEMKEQRIEASPYISFPSEFWNAHKQQQE